MYLLSQLLHALLDGAEHDIADGAGRNTVKSTPDALGRDDVEALGAGVVCTVESGGDW